MAKRRRAPAIVNGTVSPPRTGLPPLPLDLVPLYFELDGTFPNHEANPLEPENLRDLQARVLAEHADIGLAFDGDADRCFVIDERGEPLSPSAVTALVARREIGKERAAGREAVVIHNLITSRAVPEIVSEAGGTPVRTARFMSGRVLALVEHPASHPVFDDEEPVTPLRRSA